MLGFSFPIRRARFQRTAPGLLFCCAFSRLPSTCVGGAKKISLELKMFWWVLGYGPTIVVNGELNRFTFSHGIKISEIVISAVPTVRDFFFYSNTTCSFSFVISPTLQAWPLCRSVQNQRLKSNLGQLDPVGMAYLPVLQTRFMNHLLCLPCISK